MREIRFRAWDKKGKGFINGFNMFGFSIGQGSPTKFLQRFDKKWKMEDVVIQQSTGFYDKNGTEIYDGDIAKISASDLKPRIVTIIYDDLYGTWKIYDHEWSVTDDLFKYATDIEYSNSSCEVIGNIHENSDLLEASRG